MPRRIGQKPIIHQIIAVIGLDVCRAEVVAEDAHRILFYAQIGPDCYRAGGIDPIDTIDPSGVQNTEPGIDGQRGTLRTLSVA